MAVNRDGDGIFSNMVLRDPRTDRPPVLRRSNSTSSRAAPQLGIPGRVGSGSSTGTGLEELQQQQQQQQPQPRTNRRSLSAERSHWVAAPVTKPRAERWVPLPFTQYASALLEEDEDMPADALDLLAREASDQLSPTAGSYLAVGVRGRILIITACESFQREEVLETLREALPHCVLTKYPEVIHMEASTELDAAGRRTSEALEPGDVFIFDYGVVICWGLVEEAEQHVLKLLEPCQVKSLPPDEVHQEHIAFHYTADQPPHIKNDCITISRREARDVLVKMAISHGLAQSSKLNLYELRVGMLVEQVRHLPESLAKHGEIRMSRKSMAKIKGQVFIQKSEVNLLSTVLDTPDFFWSAPDALRVLYNKVCEYNELSGRIELVNSRTMLIQSMLRIWSDHKAHHHLVRLDRIVIILIVAEVIIAAAEVLGFFFGHHNAR